MRKITTAITAAALAFSMMAAAVPAAAVTGYDSAYAGESAFVNIVGGQTQNFQVFFANTGTTSWIKGTGTQVDLAACLEDKVTCNAQDASEATWNSGWLSAVRYATTTQTTTPPGSLGTFSYNITAPTGVAAGIYHFNGDVVLASTGERIHPEGYFQDANTGGATGAPTLTSLTPTSGQAGTDVTISGTGFVCTPAFPTASFGGTNGVVLSCGASSITVDAPAHALGAVTVTVSNSGSGASNGLTFTYTDVSGPTFQSFTVSGDVMTVTFSEPVCGPGATTAVDWTVRNVSAGGTTDYADVTPAVATDNRPDDCADAVATYTIILSQSIPNGSFVEATLNETAAGENSNITDASGNPADAPQSRQTTVTAPETTKPTLTSASGAVSSKTVTLNFSEPIWCVNQNGTEPGSLTISDFSVTDNTVTAINAGTCGGTRATADSSFKITVSNNLKADTSYTVTIKGSTTAETITGGNATGEIKDAVGNNLAVPASATFTSGAGDASPPTIVDARMTQNLGNSNFNDPSDQFTLTFSEVMTAGDNDLSTIGLQDQDGTVRTLTCDTTNVTCEWNDASTTVTVTVVTTIPTPGTETGTTPGMQIPFNITALNGGAFTDLQGNAANVLGSADRLVDFE